MSINLVGCVGSGNKKRNVKNGQKKSFYCMYDLGLTPVDLKFISKTSFSYKNGATKGFCLKSVQGDIEDVSVRTHSKYFQLTLRGVKHNEIK